MLIKGKILGNIKTTKQKILFENYTRLTILYLKNSTDFKVKNIIYTETYCYYNSNSSSSYYNNMNQYVYSELLYLRFKIRHIIGINEYL